MKLLSEILLASIHAEERDEETKNMLIKIK